MAHPSRSRLLVAASLAASLIVLTATDAEAQYFGGNKVQYKTFRFEVQKTDHFDVYFYPEEREAAIRAGKMAERWYARLSQILGHRLSTVQPLVLYASHADFEQTNIIEGTLGEGTGGVTEMLKRRIVLPLAATLADTDHVIGHELVHAFQYDMANDIGRGESGGSTGIERLPLWFIEGMAEYLSLGPVDPHTAMWIRDASQNEALPTIRQLDNSAKYFPYRWGQAFWAYVAGRWSDPVIGELLEAAVRGGDTDAALRRVLNVEPKDLSKDWHAAIHTAYDAVAQQTRPARDYGRLLTAAKGPAAELSVSPSISPDGKQIVYFSERNLLSVDMFLADADTGRVTRTLVKTALDPHFSSLQFINSAGSWAPDGRQFVFGAVSDGRPELVIYDIGAGRIEREIPFPRLGEILNPSWSPDGRSIAFSATAGGVSDLFIYDLVSGSLKRLTDDPFADLQPAWSPDGRSIAFVTERFGGDLTLVAPGGYRLALLDVSSGGIRPIETFTSGKSINPAWTPDGRSLYFLSDAGGVTNLCAVDIASGAVRTLSNLHGGMSGITALSPAISSSADARRLAYSAYEGGKYHIYIADAPDATRAVASTPAPDHSPAALPPQERDRGYVSEYLTDLTFGLPETEGDTGAYHPRLALDYVGQPYIAAGIDPYGTFVGGGLSFSFSDMLGNHNLGVAVQTDTSFGGLSGIAKNTAGILAYQNLTRRWNWGAAVQQVPYLSGGFSSGMGVVNGNLVQVDEMTIVRQTNRGLTGVTSYPFTRARRVEFSSGYQQVSFEQEVQTTLISPYTGEVLGHDTATTALARALHLGTAGAATVFDTSVFGATSPVAGQRYRLEVTPTAGTIFFAGALADYRRYFTPAPFYTIAGRILHYGRYGRDAEDYRLPLLFVGYPQLVRGYDIGSFEASECRPDASSSCPAFDRLLGSRLLVGNLELRFPLLRPFGVRQSMYGPLPVEVAFFADGGVAWVANDKPTFFGGDRQPVASTGMTFRVNLFGFAVGQFDIARPLQRPGQGWMFSFNLTPGF